MHCPELHELPPAPPGKKGWPWTAVMPRLPETMPNGSAWPKVTIVTPSYNQGEFLEATIRSVLLQGYPNLEYLIMDGGSSDNSVALLQKYEPWLAGWVSERDGGQAQAINKGFRQASGEWLGWLNSDDCYAPNALGKLIQAAQRQAANFVHGACTHFGDTLDAPYLRQPLPEAFRADTLRLTMEFDQPACLWQRTLFTQVGPLSEKFAYVFDWEFFIKCGPYLQLASLSDNVAYYRHHEQHKSGNGGWKRTNELLQVYLTHLPFRQRLLFISLYGSFRLLETFERWHHRHYCYRLSSWALRWLDRGLQKQHWVHPFILTMFGLNTRPVPVPVRYIYPVPGL
ncbi:MAG: glycosyltransferase family 2 protein [Caldilineaceae bacterium]